MKKLTLILALFCFITNANDITSIRQSSNILNSYTPEFHKNIKHSIDNLIPLHGRQLRLLHEVVSHYIELDTKLEKLINSEKSKKIKTLLKLDRYQNFLVSYKPFYTTTRFRRYINDEDLSFDIKAYDLNNRIMSLFNHSYLTRLNRDIKSVLESDSGDIHSTQIAKHKALSFIRDTKQIKTLTQLYKRLNKSDLRNDRLVDLTDRISGRFGNTAGSIRWRKGHLLKNKKVHQEILKKLRPLDIITEKTYFALTDKFIPGHFGHNAIWLGTKEELIQLGMWNHKSILPYQKEIEAGKSILEADRSGTHLKSLDAFMNIDEFAILRLKELNFTKSSLEEIYTTSLSQIGKVYDFNFDVETTDKIVCSELLYQSFTNIHWPTQTYLTRTKLRRTTISPDNITSLALYNDSPIELVYYVAQRKRNQTPIYKNLDQLAIDLEFAKINGLYKRIVKKCKTDKPDSKDDCDITYEDLPYTPHPYIRGIRL